MRRLWRAPGGRLGIFLVALLLLVGIGADFLASSRPVVARWRGEVYLFPNVLRPKGFPTDLDAFRTTMKKGDWYVGALVPYGPTQSRIGGQVRALRAPSARHWLGTDRAGCDVFARLIHGARVSLGVGLLTALLTALLGAGLGLLAGAGGPVSEGLLSRVAEGLVAFPPLVLLCVLQALVLRPGVISTAVVISAAAWPHVFRLVRADVCRAREMDYVIAARALGASPARVAVRHLLPAALPNILTAVAFAVPSAMLLEVSLSYLGAGLPPDTPSWGDLLHQAGFGSGRWWLVIFPGATIATAAAGMLLLADALKHLLEPRPSALTGLR